MLGVEKLDPQKFDEYAARYRAVIEIATPYGVKPLLELWGHRALHKLGDALDIAARTGLSTATISRVNRCLKYGNDGYNKVLDRLDAAEPSGDGTDRS